MMVQSNAVEESSCAICKIPLRSGTASESLTLGMSGRATNTFKTFVHSWTTHSQWAAWLIRFWSSHKQKVHPKDHPGVFAYANPVLHALYMSQFDESTWLYPTC